MPCRQQAYVPSAAHADPSTIFASSVLLLVLLASGFGRVLGFNSWIDAKVERYRLAQKQRKRDDINDTRRGLETRWEQDSDRD